MKAITQLFLLTALFLLFSCQKETNTSSLPFEAIIMGEGVDCGTTFLIEIQNDVSEIEAVTGLQDRIYYADDLATDLKQKDLHIQLEVRNPNVSELYPCTTLGIPYPHVIVLEAFKIEE